MAEADKLGFESDLVDHPLMKSLFSYLYCPSVSKGLQWPVVLEQIFMTCSGFFYKFLYPVQEFRLKIDTLRNFTSHTCL